MYILPVIISAVFLISKIYVGHMVGTHITVLFLLKIFLYIFPEVCFCGLLSMVLAKKKHYTANVLFSFMCILVYSIQAISIYKSGDMLSALAISNYDSLPLFLNNIGIAALVITALFFMFTLICIYKESKGAKIEVHTRIFVGTFVFVFLCFISQNFLPWFDSFLPFNGYSPAVSFVINIDKAFSDPNVEFHGFVSDRQLPLLDETKIAKIISLKETKAIKQAKHFNFKSFRRDFEKRIVYIEPLPFKKINNVEHPNLIIFFMEGVSARSITDFNKYHHDLTPNILKFTKNAMQVENYYNHTAATFRGIHGQLCSFWPLNGGNMGNGRGWNFNANKLSRIDYISLASILDKEKYQTAFFSPHKNGYALTQLLRTLKFKDIYTADRIPSFLRTREKVLPSGDLPDKLTMEALVKYLKMHEKDKTPFFAGLYNIETHVGFDTQPGEVKYGNGKDEVLNRLHNYDAQFGLFLKYFVNSKYANNTVVILTSDHASFPEPCYRQLVKYDHNYQPIFVDKIPLYIYASFLSLPIRYSNGLSTSVQLAPTVLQILGIKRARNTFLGCSIFDTLNKKKYGISFIDSGSTYFIYNNHIYEEGSIPIEFKKQFFREKRRMQAFQHYEQAEEYWKGLRK